MWMMRKKTGLTKYTSENEHTKAQRILDEVKKRDSEKKFILVEVGLKTWKEIEVKANGRKRKPKTKKSNRKSNRKNNIKS